MKSWLKSMSTRRREGKETSNMELVHVTHVEVLLIDSDTLFPRILISVSGQVSSGGWDSPTLVFKQLKEGILEYEFYAQKPGMGTMVTCMVSGIHAVTVYDQPEWVKQVRVGGKEGEVVEMVASVKNIHAALRYDDTTPVWTVTVGVADYGQTPCVSYKKISIWERTRERIREPEKTLCYAFYIVRPYYQAKGYSIQLMLQKLNASPQPVSFANTSEFCQFFQMTLVELYQFKVKIEKIQHSFHADAETGNVLQFLNENAACKEEVAYLLTKLTRKGLPLNEQIAGALLNLPVNLKLGTAVEEGCFFDALAQALNVIQHTQQYTEKSLRMLCYQLYSLPPNKLYIDSLRQRDASNISKEDDYSFVQYTAAELKTNFNDRKPIKGKPYIEGRLLCAGLNLPELHVIEITPGYYAFTKTNIIITSGGNIKTDAPPVSWDKASRIPVVIMEQNSLHCVPVLPIAAISADIFSPEVQLSPTGKELPLSSDVLYRTLLKLQAGRPPVHVPQQQMEVATTLKLDYDDNLEAIKIIAKNNMLIQSLPQHCSESFSQLSTAQLIPYSFPVVKPNRWGPDQEYLLCEFATEDPGSTISKIAIVHNINNVSIDQFRIYPKPNFSGFPYGNTNCAHGSCNHRLDNPIIKCLGKRSGDGSHHLWAVNSKGYTNLTPIFIHSIFLILKKHRVLAGIDTNGRLEASLQAAMSTPYLRRDMILRYRALFLYPAVETGNPTEVILKKLIENGVDGLTLSELKLLSTHTVFFRENAKDIKAIARFKLYRQNVAGILANPFPNEIANYITSYLSPKDMPVRGQRGQQS